MHRRDELDLVKELIKRGMTTEKVAIEMGISNGHAKALTKMLSQPKNIQQLYTDGKIGISYVLDK